MAKFALSGGIVVDTETALNKWEEASEWDGAFRISRNVGEPFQHETLYKTKRGTYFVVRRTQFHGSGTRAERLSPKEAATWLTLNDHTLLEDLKEFEEEIIG